jgi:hypothetical protein
MKKFFKILVYTVGITISVIILLVVIGIAIEDKLVSYTVEYVKESSPFPLKIGSTKVSLLKNFPNASVILKNVSVTSPLQKTNEYLELQELQVNFGLLGVFSNKFRINNVALKNGKVKISMTENGSELINPFLTSESTTGKTNWLVSVGSLTLENIEVDFSNSITKWNVKTQINKSEIRGFIESKGYSFSIKLRAFVHHFAQGEFTYLTNKLVDVSTNIKSTNSYYTAQSGQLSIDGITLTFSAKIGQLNELPVKIAISGNNIDTETFLRLISQQNIQLSQHIGTKGNISFSANINGIKGSTTPFNINVTFNTERFIFYLNNGTSLSIESLTGRFISNVSTSSVETTFRKIRYGNSAISGKLRAKNFSSPIVFFSGETNINLSDINSLSSSLPELSGLIQGKTEFLIKIKDPLSPSLSDLTTLKSAGNLNVSNFAMAIRGRDLSISALSGNVRLHNQSLENFSFNGKLNNSTINGEIVTCNVVPFITKAEPLNITGSLNIDELNTEWLMTSELNNNSNIVESKNDIEIGIISGPISIKLLKHKKFSSQFLSTNATIYSSRYIFDNLKGATCSGKFSGRLAVDAHNSNKQVVAGEIDAAGVEISALFNSFDSFGQSVVTDKNISGKLTGTSTFVAQLNNWTFDLATLQLSSNVSVANGKLEGITQLEGLSKFISLEELRSINFKNLENTIVIEKGEVTIPKMEIKSSVMDFVCAGNHSVNGTYSYRVALKLSDILFRKASKNNPKNAEFGTIEPDGTGNTKLYLKIEDIGKGMNVSYDRQAAREGLKTTIKSEKEVIKKAFRDEFGSIFRKSKDSVVVKKSTKFEMEWGDSTAKKDDTTNKTLQKKNDESKKTKFEIDWDDN